MSIIETMETVLQRQVEQRIEFLQHLYGVSCKLYKAKENVYSNVYGKEAGEELSFPIDIRLVITNDTFTPTDSRSAGTLTEGWVYSNSDQLSVGDKIELFRDDGKSRRYKVDAVFSLGTSTTVFKRYKIVSLGD